ncbi:hypothetical protein QQZ08_012337 [Neonectria magnoliae]|uniref:Actin-like ATPase domain-containing protein n=1 Tax=Neonectria magnoliae TaxID=2732573 RepID=A0ABR1H2Z8_9HYPO
MAAARALGPGGDAPTPVFIGIDFGTTFLGLSCLIGNVAWSHPITLSWSGGYQIKFPSKVTSSGGNILCGLMIPEGERSIEWFKLALLYRDDLDREIVQSPLFAQYENFRHEIGFRVDEATTNFFRNMWEDFFRQFLPEHRNETYEYFLTIAVPARWPRYAFDSIRKAINNSGIAADLRENCRFVTQPEATILGVIDAPARVLSPGDYMYGPDIQAGDTMLVCDCGGGTVDLGGYLVSSLNPFVVNECIPTTCSFNGSLKLDDRFMALLENKVNNIPTHVRFNSRKKRCFRSFSEKHWEFDMKRNFGGEQSVWTYEVPSNWLDSAAKNDRPQLRFTNEELAAVFEPVLNIAQLVEVQIHDINMKMGKPPKYVLVAGGFGLILYLQRAIYERVNSVANALESASAIQVDGYVTRASYGIQSPFKATPDWFSREGQVMSITRTPPLILDPSAFKITLGTDGTAVLGLTVYYKKVRTQPSPCFYLEWKSGLDVRAFGPGSPGIQM